MALAPLLRLSNAGSKSIKIRGLLNAHDRRKHPSTPAYDDAWAAVSRQPKEDGDCRISRCVVTEQWETGRPIGRHRQTTGHMQTDAQAPGSVCINAHLQIQKEVSRRTEKQTVINADREADTGRHGQKIQTGEWDIQVDKQKEWDRDHDENYDHHEVWSSEFFGLFVQWRLPWLAERSSTVAINGGSVLDIILGLLSSDNTFSLCIMSKRHVISE